MATSSSRGIQVFINFRGEDVRKNFISFLTHELRQANITTFTDEDELLGSDLANLFLRIEESRIALVIFSKDYANSTWCLDELAKIKELKDQNRIIVIPIFYRLVPSVVKELRGDFGDNFRDLERKHPHQPERTRKWKEALETIPLIIGMPLSQQSDKTDREFISSLVVKIQRLLDHMAMVPARQPEREADCQGDSMVPSMVPARQPEREADRQGGSMVPSMVPARQPEREADRQGGSMVPSMVPARQPEREADRQGGSMVPSMAPARQPERETNRQGCSVVPIMVPARQLEITHSENDQKWVWSTIYEAPKYAALEIAKMKQIHWLKIVGKFETGNLTPGTQYEVVFLVKLEDGSCGWEQPVTLRLKVEQQDGSDNRVDKTLNVKKYIGHGWVDILAGVFVAPPTNAPAKITFTMSQYETDDKKRGLIVKGVAIRPTK